MQTLFIFNVVQLVKGKKILFSCFILHWTGLTYVKTNSVSTVRVPVGKVRFT